MDGAAARIRSSGAGLALRCRDGPLDASTLTSHFVLARCPRASHAVRRFVSAACARLRAAARPTQLPDGALNNCEESSRRYFPGTSRLSSSNQFNTTTTSSRADGSIGGATSLIIRKRLPSEETSKFGTPEVWVYSPEKRNLAPSWVNVEPVSTGTTIMVFEIGKTTRARCEPRWACCRRLS